MYVKLCGITQAEQALAIDRSKQIDYIGFIFYSKSKRFVTSTMPSTKVKRVGVFVDSTIEEILQLTEEFSLDIVQLHGSETPAFCETLRNHLPVMKAFSIGEEFPTELVARYQDSVDYLLFDTETEYYGGSGRTFDWNLLQKYEGKLPFFLSGGIGPANIEQLKSMQHPNCIGIDLNSKFEIEPGIKNLNLVMNFIQELHNEHISASR